VKEVLVLVLVLRALGEIIHRKWFRMASISVLDFTQKYASADIFISLSHTHTRTKHALYVKGSRGRTAENELNNNNLWEYRGCVTLSEPSNTFNLTWPIDPGTSQFYEDASIGVSLEPLEECLQKDAKISGSKELFAQRVALDLWNFLKSFTSGNETEHLVVPRNVFDSWYQKFTTKFRRDPDFLTRNVNVV
jgi:hypothetical protein